MSDLHYSLPYIPVSPPDDMEYESDVEEPICEESEDDLGLEFSDEEERLAYCVIYKILCTRVYNYIE